VPAGPPITTPGGHCHYLGGATTGIDGIRAAVREHAGRGVEVIKIMASGGNLTPGTHPELAQFSDQELRAAVDEAHRYSLPIIAHAHGTPAIAAAVAAGVDGLEHVSFLTPDGVDVAPPDLVVSVEWEATQVEENGSWVWSDAWVLAAIMGSADKDTYCSLADVVSAGDGINHAILMDVEVERAVRRLLGVGLICTRQRQFSLTESGQALADSRRGGLMGQVDHLWKALRRKPASEQPWDLQPGELDAASQAWHREAGRIKAQLGLGKRRVPKRRPKR